MSKIKISIEAYRLDSDQGFSSLLYQRAAHLGNNLISATEKIWKCIKDAFFSWSNISFSLNAWQWIPNPTWSCLFQFPSVGGELESFGLGSIFKVGWQTTPNVDGVDLLVTTPLNIVHKSHDDLLEIRRLKSKICGEDFSSWVFEVFWSRFFHEPWLRWRIIWEGFPGFRHENERHSTSRTWWRQNKRIMSHMRWAEMSWQISVQK